MKPALVPTLRGYRRSWIGGDAAAGRDAAGDRRARAARQLPVGGNAADHGLLRVPGRQRAVRAARHQAHGCRSERIRRSRRCSRPGSRRWQRPALLGTCDLVGILAVMAGVLVALVWLLRLGWIAELLSAPIIAGFLAGVGVVIIVHQLPDLLGLQTAGGSTLARLRDIADHLGDANGWTIAIGLGVLGDGRRARSESIAGSPAPLIALAGSTALVSLAGLEDHGVAVLGPVAHGAPQLGLRGLTWHTIGQLAPLAGVVALVDRDADGRDDEGLRATRRTRRRRRPGPDGGRRRQRRRGADRRLPGQRQPTAHRCDRSRRGALAGHLAARRGRGGGADPGRRDPPRRAAGRARGGARVRRRPDSSTSGSSSRSPASIGSSWRSRSSRC